MGEVVSSVKVNLTICLVPAGSAAAVAAGNGASKHNTTSQLFSFCILSVVVLVDVDVDIIVVSSAFMRKWEKEET